MSARGRLRIAYGRISQESNALSPARTTMEDFRRTHFLEGAALELACSRLAREVPGFLRNAELSGFVRGAYGADADVELVPLFSAWSVPSGPISRDCFAELSDRLETSLRRAGRVDAVYLSMHGAMGAEGVRDPETELLRIASRATHGAPLAASYDLHANLTKERVESAILSCAYRTNPHRDHARTGATAGRLLVRTLRGEISPTTAWRSLPMILGGGTTLDFLSPMRGIFRRMSELERKHGVLTASVCMCHVWNDDPELGWSTLVTTDGDRARAEAFADELAERCWEARHQLPPRFASPSEAVEKARRAVVARATGVVTVCDASDVVPAGATGDNTRLLRTLLEEGRGLLSYVPLRDPRAIERLWGEPDGATVALEIGGTVDPGTHDPLGVSGRIIARRPEGPFGRIVVLDLGHVRVVITEGQPLVMKPAFYNEVGLPVHKADIVVVKSFFPFLLYFLPYSRKTIYVRSRGITDFDAAFRLPFTDPVHPRDRVDDWRATDRRRRGVP